MTEFNLIVKVELPWDDLARCLTVDDLEERKAIAPILYDDAQYAHLVTVSERRTNQLMSRLSIRGAEWISQNRFYL